MRQLGGCGGADTLGRVSEYDVRIAAFEELDARTAYLLWQLRESIFVVEQDCPYQELDGRDLEPATRHIWVEDAGRPVGYLRVLEDEGLARIGRVLVAAGHRGRGIAGALMRETLTLIGARPARLDAQSYLAGWYAGFGFEQAGPEFLEDGIAHIPMRRA
jgi:ElaA protein